MKASQTVADALGKLGLYGRDRVHGDEGYITSIGFDLYGCLQLLISPVGQTDVDKRKSYWYDESRIQIDTAKERVMPVPAQFLEQPAIERAAPAAMRGPAEKPEGCAP